MMVAGGERAIAEVAVVGGGELLCTPCGGCRQRLAEFGRPETKVHLAGPEGLRETVTLGSLLPMAFGPINLGGEASAAGGRCRGGDPQPRRRRCGRRSRSCWARVWATSPSGFPGL